MKKRSVDLRGGNAPILDIVSYGRGGGSGRFTKEQLELIARTVSRTPGVMVKVSGGARSLRGASAHFGYISRQASLDLETDEGGAVRDKDGLKGLIRDWDLDIEVITPSARGIKKPVRGPKLVHNLIFSMPAGTPADKVLKAVKKLAQEEWALKHRYAMVLHTDEPHPHVHVVLKARSEQGYRLNIRKATLRDWRQRFATHLRELGVNANATERMLRAQPQGSLSNGHYRLRQRIPEGMSCIRGKQSEREISSLEEHSSQSIAIQSGWRKVSADLKRFGERQLADQVDGYVDSIRLGRSERQLQFPAVPDEKQHTSQHQKLTR